VLVVEQPKPKPKAQKDEMPEDMIPWWAVYPKHEGKAYAIRKWRECAKIRPPVDDMITTLRWQIELHQWTKDTERYQFIPAPGVYLNQKKWTDERPTLVAGKTGGNGHKDGLHTFEFRGQMVTLNESEYRYWGTMSMDDRAEFAAAKAGGNG